MIDIVWLKRDLRLTDHAPLLHASHTSDPLLLLYIIEPMLINDPHYDSRHWRFIWQSLQDIQDQLDGVNAKLHIFLATQSLFSIRCIINTVFTLSIVMKKLALRSPTNAIKQF